MKIAIVCYPTYGGSGVVATELGISLAALGLSKLIKKEVLFWKNFV